VCVRVVLESGRGCSVVKSRCADALCFRLSSISRQHRAIQSLLPLWHVLLYRNHLQVAGAVNINGGSSSAASSDGGSVTLTGGSGLQRGGSITLSTGTSTGTTTTSGDISVRTADACVHSSKDCCKLTCRVEPRLLHVQARSLLFVVRHGPM
jgi:hypothetical protein